MNRLQNIVGLIAVCATAAFFTGCGEKDTSGGGGSNSNAPATLAGKSYTLSDAATGGTISFDANNNYQLVQNGSTNEVGTFTSNKTGETWDVTLVDSAATTNSQLTLNYSGPDTGTYTFQRPGQAPVNGSFALAGGNPGGTTGGDTTGGNTTGGTGTVTPPATLNAITVTTAQSGIGSNSVYTVTFNGGQFTTQNTQGETTGSGTYTYTPDNNSKTGHLVMNYTQPTGGDYDDMTLVFTTPAGGGANNFSGQQSVGGTVYPFTGTFSY